MYQVTVGKEAAQFFEKADAALQRRLDRAFDALKLGPRRHNNIKPLHGRFDGLWRYRVGDYRMIYQIDDSQQRVHVTAIVHRGQAYD